MKKRRLFWIAVCGIAVPTLVIGLLHTQPLRRAVLVQLSAYLRRSQGIVLQAQSLDYNLFSPWFLLEKVSLRSSAPEGLPPFIVAERVRIRLRFRDLVRGSLRAHVLEIERLRLDAMVRKDGSTNVSRNLPATTERMQMQLPVDELEVSTFSLFYNDERTGFSVRLPAGTVKGSINPATGDQEIDYTLLEHGGISWGGREMPVKNLTLGVLLQGDGIALKSLHVDGEGIEIQAGGTLQDPESRQLNVAAHVDIQCSGILPRLGFRGPVEGRVQAGITVSGRPERFTAEGELRSDGLKLAGLRWNSLAANGRFESSTGTVELRELTAKLYTGQIRAHGQLWLNGQGQSTIHVEGRAPDLRRIGAALGWCAPPRVGASARFTISCPGTQWQSAKMNADVGLVINSDAGIRPGPGITAHLTGQLREQQLHVGLDSISGYGASLQGFLDVGIQNRSVAGELRGRIGSLARLIHNLESDFGASTHPWLPFRVDGGAELRAKLSGSLKDPRASIDLDGTSLSAGRVTDAGLHLHGEYALEGLAISAARLDWHGQSATFAGEIGLATDSSPLHVEADAEQVSISDMLMGMKLDADVHGTASAKITATGTRSDPRISARIEARGIEAYGELLGSLGAEAEWHGRSLVLSRLKLDKPQQGEDGTLEAGGAADFGSRQYEFSLIGENLQPVNLRWLKHVPVRGTLRLNADGKGDLDNPTIRVEAEWKDLVVADQKMGVLRGELQLSNHRARFNVENAALGIEAGVDITTLGAFPIRFDLTTAGLPYSFRTAGKQVATITSAAVVHGEGSLRPAEVQEVSVLLKNFQLEIGKKEIRSEGPLDFRYSGHRFYLRPATFASGQIRLQASGDMPLEDYGEPGKISLTGTVDLHSIVSLLSAEEAIDAHGKAMLEAEIRGSWRSLSPSATMTLEAGSLHSAALAGTLEDLNAIVRLGDRRISLDSLSAKIGEGTIHASADVPVEFFILPSGVRGTTSVLPARFSVAADKVPLPLATQPGRTIGVFSATLRGESPRPALEAITAQLDVAEFSLYRDSFSIQQVEPATLTIRDGAVRIDGWRWAGPQGELQLAGTLGLTGEHRLDLHISGTADATICSLLSPNAFGRGSLRMDLRAIGPLRNPLFSGFLETEKGSIGIKQPRILLEDLDLKIGLDRDRFDVRTMNGLLNGGRIQGSGSAFFHQRKLAALNIDLVGQDVFLEFPPGAKSSSSLRLRAHAEGSEVVIGGEVGIREGSYVEPFDFSGKSSTDLIGKVDSRNKTQVLGSSVRYDIKIRTLQPFEINNNLARVSARADMRLVGDPATPGMLGTITLDRGGKLYFGGRVYYTERGTVSFANEGRIDPVYDLVAATQVNDYQVSLRLSGTGSEIAATFTSDPPLSQNDIVALLLTGKPLSESGGSRVDPAQAERLSLLTGVLNADLSARMRRRFGISQVMIQPSLISGESDPGARLTVGQDLSESLRFVYSMNLVNSADQIWYTEYDFHRRLTARATMQSDNTYRTDFQQDLRFGGRKAGSSEMSPASSRKLRVGKVEFTGSPIFEPTRLAREFKIAPGNKFNFAKSRKGIERLQKFYAKQGYLAARMYMDRDDQDQRVNLTVQVEAGKKVNMQYAGARIPKSVDKQVRKIWQEGITDKQRAEDAERRLRAYLFKRGYPQANVGGRIDEVSPDEKRVIFELQTGVHYKRVEAVFQGAAPEHAASIAMRLKLRKIGDEVGSRPARIIEDVTSYYRQKGYFLAAISMPQFEADEKRRTARLVFLVNEGPHIRIRTLQFQGNRALTTAELRKNLPLKEGSVLDPDELKKTVAAIAGKYGKNGYRNPEVVPTTVLDQNQGLVELTFVVKEGIRSIIQSVRVDGEDRVSKKYISRQLRMTAGKPQDVPETNQSIRNLYNTGAFAKVDIESVPSESPPTRDSGTEKVDVIVKVQEVAPFKLLYGGYYDSGRGPGGIAEIETRNFLGGARVIGLRTRYDRALQEFRMYFSQPLWRGHSRPTTATVYDRREEDYYEGLSAERTGFTLQQEISLQKKVVASFGYRFENVDLWYPDQHAPNPPGAIVAPLTFSLTRSTRDDFLDPTKGSFTSVAVELGPRMLGSTYGYTRLFSQYFKYFPLRKPGYVPFQDEVKKPRFVYATGIRLGLIKGLTADQVIPTERFYAGGGTTVRGFKQDTLGPLDQNGDPLGGNAMAVLNNELRFPMFSIFDGVAFVDIGNVFPLVKDFKFSELRKTAGFGLRLRTPSLMLRFDYGFKLDRRPGESRGAFFFSIGQAF